MTESDIERLLAQLQETIAERHQRLEEDILTMRARAFEDDTKDGSRVRRMLVDGGVEPARATHLAGVEHVYS